MDKKFLAEHESKFNAEFRKYKKNLIKNPLEPHPIISQLGKVEGPIVVAEPHCHFFDKEKLWSQIPFAGALIVSLFNVPKEMCLRENGFDPKDIPELVRLTKETGKIKFVIRENTLEYEGLDYLDPIFEEFELPQYTSADEDNDSTDEEKQKWANEFFAHGSLRYLDELRYNVLKSGGSEKFVKALIFGRGQTWIAMRELGMDDEIEELSNLMVDSPGEAEELFSACIMKTAPITDPVTQNYNYSLSRLNRFKVKPDLKSGIRLPELGKLLMKKLVLNPGSYYGCVNAIQKYEDNDLYKLFDSFQIALQQEKPDKIIESKKALEEIIDNVWNDVKNTSKRIKDVRGGLSISLGIGGALGTASLQGAAASDPAFASIAALTGVLAGLGFNTFENRFNIKKNLSEKIVSRFKPNYIVNILDFSKKYDLK